jgi:hypothetical protein
MIIMTNVIDLKYIGENYAEISVGLQVEKRKRGIRLQMVDGVLLS